MRCELISMSEVQRLCMRLATRIQDSGYQPDIIVAIARGGLVPARYLCDYLDIMMLTSIKIEHYLAGSNRQQEAIIRYPLCVPIENQRVLLVDDVNDSGDTLEVAMQHLRGFNPREIRSAVMHHKLGTQFHVDYPARTIIKWRWLVYPWALIEDLSEFIQQLSPAPTNLHEVQRQLESQFGIRLSQQKLKQYGHFLYHPVQPDTLNKQEEKR